MAQKVSGRTSLRPALLRHDEQRYDDRSRYREVRVSHGVDAAGEVAVRRKLTRGRVLAFFKSLPRCLVGIEACSSSHYWARDSPHLATMCGCCRQYVKPYLKRQKNDAADAEAICEAVTRPTMRFVPVKSPEQQSVMMLHRVRLMLNRQRTQISNALRAHLSEFGIVAPIGRNGIEQLLYVINDENDARIGPPCESLRRRSAKDDLQLEPRHCSLRSCVPARAGWTQQGPICRRPLDNSAREHGRTRDGRLLRVVANSMQHPADCREARSVAVSFTFRADYASGCALRNEPR